jgi:hypothetical protein
MNEASKIDKWIFSVVTTDQQLSALIGQKCYFGEIPSGKQPPAVVFSFQAGRDTHGNGGGRLLTSPLYQIKALGVFNAQLITIADRIDEIFKKATNVLFEDYVFCSRREQQINLKMPGSDVSNPLRHLGGLYRISCYKNPNS